MPCPQYLPRSAPRARATTPETFGGSARETAQQAVVPVVPALLWTPVQAAVCRQTAALCRHRRRSPPGATPAPPTLALPNIASRAQHRRDRVFFVAVDAVRPRRRARAAFDANQREGVRGGSDLFRQSVAPVAADAHGCVVPATSRCERQIAIRRWRDGRRPSSGGDRERDDGITPRAAAEHAADAVRGRASRTACSSRRGRHRARAHGAIVAGWQRGRRAGTPQTGRPRCATAC
jgi:hypothetical protein